MVRFKLIDSTAASGARKAAPPAGGLAPELPPPAALGRFLARRHRFPTFSRNHSYHTISPRAPGSLELRRTLRRLQGKFVVVNPAFRLSVPPAVADNVRAAAQLAGIPIDARDVSPAAAAAGAPAASPPAPADWLALALYEPAAAVIHHRGGGTHAAGADVDVEFVASLDYRLVLFVGRGDPENAAGDLARAMHRVAAGELSLDAGATEAGDGPAYLFTLGIYTPDDDALRQMADPTAQLYKQITGRLGVGSRERYWHLETWERFGEHGMLAGCVTPAQVEHARAVAAGDGGRSPQPAPPTYEEFLFGTGGASEPSRWQALTPTYDRRAFIPPGYCLVEYTARVAMSLVEVGG